MEYFLPERLKSDVFGVYYRYFEELGLLPPSP